MVRKFSLSIFNFRAVDQRTLLKVYPTHVCIEIVLLLFWKFMQHKWKSTGKKGKGNSTTKFTFMLNKPFYNIVDLQTLVSNTRHFSYRQHHVYTLFSDYTTKNLSSSFSQAKVSEISHLLFVEWNRNIRIVKTNACRLCLVLSKTCCILFSRPMLSVVQFPAIRKLLFYTFSSFIPSCPVGGNIW